MHIERWKEKIHLFVSTENCDKCNENVSCEEQSKAHRIMTHKADHEKIRTYKCLPNLQKTHSKSVKTMALTPFRMTGIFACSLG